jgi:tRNA 2-selenouridine synthase SelU
MAGKETNQSVRSLNKKVGGYFALKNINVTTFKAQLMQHMAI